MTNGAKQFPELREKIATYSEENFEEVDENWSINNDQVVREEFDLLELLIDHFDLEMLQILKEKIESRTLRYTE